MSQLSRRQFQTLGAALLGFPAIVRAQGKYPSRPVRVVVPFAPGGGTDTLGRAIAQKLSDALGQPFVIDNKPGAGGIIGTDAVAKAAPDGYTLSFNISTALLINQFLYTKLPYNPQKDLALVTQIAAAPVTLVVHPSVPANNMKELLAYAKSHKGKLSYGSWGTGSYAHLAGAYMSKTMDADMVHVAYKGEAPMIQELIGGQLQLCFSSALNTKPFIDAGRVKAIGVTGTQRMDILPKVPTIFEQGVQDDAYSIFGWVAVGAPAGTPKDVIDQLYAHLREVAKDPKVLERISGAGFLPLMNSPQEFQQNYQRDLPIWKHLVEAAGARLD